ncbi:hypothetical protein [Saccharothrix syringae]|uniref:Uncharacterized protein n=1 Tax=Saccharothrix syringae TaxID=103733 RepID=A0A5Q0H3P6_SACSY|nr:hypothetical protein [Saccharothrix syringae]QFZ20545.1 hypothetical protein EKG83_26845 [Saccharothrix syringae]
MSLNTRTRRLCKACYDATRPKETCHRCGQWCAPYKRTPAGPLCARCHRATRPTEPCTDCGKTRTVTARPHGHPVCGSCWRRRTAERCTGCGRIRPVRTRTPDGPTCATCFTRAQPPGTCSGCGRHGPIKLKKRSLCNTCAIKERPPEPCRDCGHTRPVATRDERGPQCHSCWRTQHRAHCTRCGQARPVLGKLDGQPYCPYCWEIVKPSTNLCVDCGRRPALLASRDDGRRRCRPCHCNRKIPCARCGTPAKAERTWPEGPVCLTCVDTVRFTHVTCTTCRQHRPVFRRDHHGNPTCPECAGVRFTYTCTACGGMGRIHSRGLCPSCRARERLDELFATGTTSQAAELALLREHLAGYPSPYSLIAYLNGAGGQLLHRLISGDLACTHDALDRLHQTGSVAHLRDLLSAAGVLPSRDEHLVRVQHRTQALLDEVDERANRLLLARYLRWVLLPAAHQQAERDGRLAPQRAGYLLEQLRTAQAFTNHLRGVGSALAHCTQPQIDAWLAAQRWRTSYLRQFLTWAALQEEAPRHVAVTALTTGEDRSIMNDADRLLLAHRLEHDDTIALVDRVAGCLVLQYGQQVSRIARLTIDDVREHPAEPGVLGLVLGSDPLWLRPKLSHLLARLITDRRSDRVLIRSVPNPYLFPGAHPGRPLGSDTLARRLKTLGINKVRHARNGALLALVGSVHWKLLADLLGISDSAAQRWHVAAGGDRASYVASRLKQDATTGPE